MGCPSLGPHTLLGVPAWVLTLVSAFPSPWGLGMALSLHFGGSHLFLFLGLRLFSSSSSLAPSLQSPELGAPAHGPWHGRSSHTGVMLRRQRSREPGCNAGGCPSSALVLDVNGPLETLF